MYENTYRNVPWKVLLHALTGLFKFQPPPESISPVGYLQESLYHQLNSESANPRNGSFHNAHN